MSSEIDKTIKKLIAKKNIKGIKEFIMKFLPDERNLLSV